jgi:selenoprotein W-related protein
MEEDKKGSVAIYYCYRCRWLSRAVWMAQEILNTFELELSEVALRPGESGQFDIIVNGENIFSRKDSGHFPELKEIKQKIRDLVCPDKKLGHSDL